LYEGFRGTVDAFATSFDHLGREGGHRRPSLGLKPAFVAPFIGATEDAIPNADSACDLKVALASYLK